MPDEIDDLFADDDETDKDSDKETNLAKLRQIGERKDKEAEKLRKQVESLTAQVEKDASEKRSSTLAASAKQLGIKDKHVGFYPADADPSPEAMKQWAIDQELIAPGSGEKTTDEKQEGFDSGGLGGNDESGPAGVISSEEALALYEKDPQAYLRAARAGKVEGIDSNGQVTFDIDYGGAYRYPSS